MTTIATPCLRAIALSAAATLAIGLAVTATPASATTYVFQGNVIGGYDETGVFGFAGQQLAGRGLTFTATIVRQDLPGAYYIDEPTYSSVGGFLANSPLQASVSINGHTFELGSYLGQQFQDELPDLCGPGCIHEQFEFNAQAYQNTLDAGSGVTTYLNHGLDLVGFGDNQDFLASGDYHTLGPLTAADGVNYFGQLFLENYTLNSIGTRTSYDHGIAYLAPTSLTVDGVGAPTGGVPEPAAWALMILGFGAAGTMLRRRARWAGHGARASGESPGAHRAGC